MPASLRLRQICLAAPRLEPLIADLVAIFGLSVCHRDPGLIAYGLENALLPIGSDFLEVVAPVQVDTAAGRFIQRSRGHGGYMAIFQAEDPRRRQAAAAALGVRTAHEIDRPGYQSVQLHPRDCRAAFIEFGHSPGGEQRSGTWWPAGPHWQDHVQTDQTRRLLAIELESPTPATLAQLWSNLLALPLATDDGLPALWVDGVAIRFVYGASDCLGALRLEVADLPATLARALACGLRLEGEDGHSFHLGGVYFRLQAEAGAAPAGPRA